MYLSIPFACRLTLTSCTRKCPRSYKYTYTVDVRGLFTGEASYSEVSPPISVAVSSSLASESSFLSKHVRLPRLTCITSPCHRTRQCISNSSVLVTTRGVDCQIRGILKNSLLHAFDAGHEQKKCQPPPVSLPWSNGQFFTRVYQLCIFVVTHW